MEIRGDEGDGNGAAGAGKALLKSGLARRRFKAALGHLLYRSGLYKLPWRHRAMIVLFHRVDDRYPGEPITCSRAQFAAFCDFFARYFEVVTLSELLELLRRGADVSRRLVITFDDGYRDNYEVAAAELRKRDLPACFFVATGFVGSDQVAPWDAKRSIRSEWMTWDEVRSLLGQGFELGAHTITHPDLGRLAGAEARREIAGSKAQLEAEVGAPIGLFAYPYGGANQMTEENRAIVRDAGFSCCLSAHGGVVRAADSPFRLKRAPIHAWYLSPYQFGFEAVWRWLSKPAAGRQASGP
jgi:peptidoglycan/xylan/chitin deacetylase (PgdA/CDA1 family)